MAAGHADTNRAEMGLAGRYSGSDSDDFYTDSDYSDDGSKAPCVRTSPWLLATLAMSALAATALLVYVLYGGQSSDTTKPTKVVLSAEPAGTASFVPSTMNYAMLTPPPTPPSSISGMVAASHKSPGSTVPALVSATNLSSAPIVNASTVNVSAPAAVVANTRRKPVNVYKPEEHMHDGNPCDDTEELYAGLCYRKCSLLTNGMYPHRSTAFSCCATSNCALNVFNLHTASLIPCDGYDVSSADNSTACPHFPGTCLTDEEQFLGQCYEKCSVLTQGKFPNRVAAMTCCKAEGLECFNPLNDKTKPAFLVGGGKGDHDAQTPHGPHGPLQSLTEAQA